MNITMNKLRRIIIQEMKVMEAITPETRITRSTDLVDLQDFLNEEFDGFDVEVYTGRHRGMCHVDVTEAAIAALEDGEEELVGSVDIPYGTMTVQDVIAALQDEIGISRD
jgi:hypothetical protein